MGIVLQEFNIEKLQLVEAEKAKIRKEYERKEKQVETKKKIEYSTQLNAARLRLLQAQDDIVKSVKEQTDKQLATVGSGDSYKNLLQGLILQASHIQTKGNKGLNRPVWPEDALCRLKVSTSRC